MIDSDTQESKYVTLIQAAEEAKRSPDSNFTSVFLGFQHGQACKVIDKPEGTPRPRLGSEGLTDSISGNTKGCFTFFSELFNTVCYKVSNCFSR